MFYICKTLHFKSTVKYMQHFIEIFLFIICSNDNMWIYLIRIYITKISLHISLCLFSYQKILNWISGLHYISIAQFWSEVLAINWSFDEKKKNLRFWDRMTREIVLEEKQGSCMQKLTDVLTTLHLKSYPPYQSGTCNHRTHLEPGCSFNWLWAETQTAGKPRELFAHSVSPPPTKENKF